jgi:hypothetical protein
VRIRILAVVVALAAVLSAWTALASMALLWVLGFWGIYPWPTKLWMWARYALEAPPNAIVDRWLIISGIVAALPLLATGVLLIALIRRVMATSASLYGKTAWATPAQMRAAAISTDRTAF